MDMSGKINSEEEYWEEHKKFMEQLKDIKKKKRFDELNNLFNHAERVGLFSKEDLEKWRKLTLRAFQGKL